MTTSSGFQAPVKPVTGTDDSRTADESGSAEIAMSVSGGPRGYVYEPIHESLTLSALISSNSGVSSDTSISNASNHDWEYIRGAIWNDDPDGKLFNDSEIDNHKYSLGLEWAAAYKRAEQDWNPNNLAANRLKSPTGRSHYGDLQFLHCMASNRDEDPKDTKEKVMTWMEVMYKLATGEDGITPNTEVSQTKLDRFCPPKSLPPSWMSLTYLLSEKTPFKALDIKRRALGSMFHVIQDSYAIGHTKRELINKEYKISDNPLKFQKGVADRWGPIINFHTYFGQDGDSHKHYDHANDGIPNPSNLGNLDQWNGLIGCRDAVDACKRLAEKKNAGESWATVSKWLDTEVFALHKDVTPSNNTVL